MSFITKTKKSMTLIQFFLSALKPKANVISIPVSLSGNANSTESCEEETANHLTSKSQTSPVSAKLSSGPFLNSDGEVSCAR